MSDTVDTREGADLADAQAPQGGTTPAQGGRGGHGGHAGQAQDEGGHSHGHGGCGGHSHADGVDARRPSQLGGDPDAAAKPAGCNGQGGCGGAGGCGSHAAPPRVPVLDARTIDPLIRQAAIFGVLVGLPPNQAVTIVTDADPTPMAALLEERLPGEYAVEAVKTDDDEWRFTVAR